MCQGLFTLLESSLLESIFVSSKAEFVPVIEEYYLWAYPLSAAHDEDIESFIATLADPEFQRLVNELPGYQCDHCGEAVSVDWLFN